MLPISSSASPHGPTGQGVTVAGRPQRPWPLRTTPLVATVFAVGAVAAGVAWYRHKPGPTAEQRQAIAELRREPILKGLPGWRRTSYIEYAQTSNGTPLLLVRWHSPHGVINTRRRLVARYKAIYGPAPGGDVRFLDWDPVMSVASRMSIAFYGDDLDGPKGTDISVDMTSGCSCK